MAERWKVHPLWADYAISDCGRVKRVTPMKGTRIGKILKPGLSSSGYHVVNITGHMRKIHRLMLETFDRLPRPGEKGLHKNDIKLDNRMPNLRWGTHAANYADRVKHGGGNQGSRHGLAKLTEIEVADMRLLYPTLHSVQLGALYGVSPSTVHQIVKRQRWRHV